MSNALPRSQAVVDRIAGPRIAREKKALRRFRIGAAMLLVLLVGLPLLTGGDAGVVCGVGTASLLAVWLVLWMVTSRASGHAADIVRNGLAYPARVEVEHGGGRSRIGYVVTWIENDGGEGRRVLPPPSATGAPPFGDKTVVLVLPGCNRVGILVSDYLDVL